MGTRITYEGVDRTLDLDDQAITLSDPSAGSGRSGGGDDAAGREPASGEAVVIPRWEVRKVTLEPASLLRYGKLVIETSGGRQHTVEFTRDAEERFTNLAAILG